MWNFIRRRWYVVLAAVVLLVFIPSAVLFFRSVRMVKEFAANPSLQPAVIYDRNGRLIERLGQQGERVTLEEVPEHLKEAIVAVEDARFYRHRGVDVLGVLRAFWANLRAGRRAQGASTITMQLARNIFLYPDKTWSRKIQETFLALALESQFSKDEILEMYLNRIYFGEGAYGVGAASRIYFNKPVSQLDLAESALIAGLPQAPSKYSPYTHLEEARERRNHVLERMAAVGAIDEKQAEAAKKERITLQRRTGGRARYFLDWLTNVLVAELGETAVFEGGLTVHTSLDLDMQAAAEAAFGRQNHQGALVALDPETGGILAMVGGRDYRQSQFNRATQARRQPGSAIKPIIYAAALKEGMQVNTLVDDTQRSFADYEPKNFNDQYWGRVTMKHALAMSLNSAAVWTLNELGVDKAMQFAREVGLNLHDDDRNLALALGGISRGISPLDLAGAYSIFPSGGIYRAPHAIVRIVDRDGKEIRRQSNVGKQVLTEEQAYLMTDMLRAAMEYGTGRSVEAAVPAAGKTGTTNGNVDLWFVGYTPEIVCAVYVGNDDRTPVEGTSAGTAGAIWWDFLEQVVDPEGAPDFPVPANVETGIMIEIFTGLLATERCRHVEYDAFVKGTAPTEYAPCAFPPAPPPEAEEPPATEAEPETQEPPETEPEPEEVEPPPEEEPLPEAPSEPPVEEEPVPEEPAPPEAPVEPEQPPPQVPVEPEPPPQQPLEPVEPPPPPEPQLPAAPQEPEPPPEAEAPIEPEEPSQAQAA